MHSVNGYVFGNLPLDAMTMKKGERVRWYLMGMGTEVDLHTPHWHGNTVTVIGMRTDVVSLLPATMVDGRHGPRRPRHVALPLPRQRSHQRRNAGPLPDNQRNGPPQRQQRPLRPHVVTGNSSRRWPAERRQWISDAPSAAPALLAPQNGMRPAAT